MNFIGVCSRVFVFKERRNIDDERDREINKENAPKVLENKYLIHFKIVHAKLILQE